MAWNCDTHLKEFALVGTAGLPAVVFRFLAAVGVALPLGFLFFSELALARSRR